LKLFFDISKKKLTTRNQLKNEFEERFHQKWTSLSVQYHFKAIASKLFSIPFSEVAFNLKDEVTDEELLVFQSFLLRLEVYEPLQHIVGETEFMGLPILCSSSALIPRPETEELVELILEKVKSQVKKDFHVLDLCTGTGCIAIALQKLLPNAKITALDYFDDTIELAHKNCELNKISVEILKVNVLSESEMAILTENFFDIWVSNPPYIPESDKSKMEDNVLRFEPGAALFVPNDDPLLFYKIITRNATNSLKENGWLFFEIHEDFGKELIALLKQNKFRNIGLVKDMQGKNRMIYGQK